jgi:hypothetical protein
MITSIDEVTEARSEFEALLPFATDIERKHMEAILLYGSASAASRALNMADTTLSRAVIRVRKRAAMQGHSPKHDMVHTVPNPFIVKGVSTYYNRDGVAAGQWVKSSLDDTRRQELLQEMVRTLAEEVKPAAPLAYTGSCESDLLTVYPLGDPHAGLYSWKDETGSHYDLDEFERVNIAAIDRLVSMAPPSKIALFNDKGDLTHADNNKNRTPRSGHALDVHGRHSQVVRIAVKVKIHCTQRLLEKHEKVIIRIDPGNHDEETALMIAMIIEAFYRNEPRVEVVTSPNPYWYYSHGKVLIGTCHGDGAKGKDLPAIMANDVRELWGAARDCVWFVGHVHHRDEKEYRGCDVIYVNTLAAPDYYSHHAGYRSKRRMTAVTYHKERGEETRHTCNVEALVG